MFNSPLKPVVKRPVVKQQLRHHSQRFSTSLSLFDPLPSQNDSETVAAKKPYRLDLYISYSSRLTRHSSSSSSQSKESSCSTPSSFTLHHELMFRKFIPLEKHFHSNYDHHYRNVCMKALFHSRLEKNLEETSRETHAMNSNISTPLSSSSEPYSPFSSSSFPTMKNNTLHSSTPSHSINRMSPRKNSSKKKEHSTFSAGMSFHYKGRMGFTSMQFIPTTSACMSPPILVTGDAEGSIQLFSIGHVHGSPKTMIEKPSLKISVPMKSFVNRICTTKSGGCLVASDDSTLFFYDLCRPAVEGCQPTVKFEGHTNDLTDVKKNTWENLFMSSSMDKSVKLWSPQLSKPLFSLNIKEYVHSCCWMPYSNHYLLTCSQKVITAPCSESCIKIWDLRKLSSHVCEIIENGKFNELRSSLTTFNDDDSESESDGDNFGGSSFFGFWSASSSSSSSRKSWQRAALTSFGAATSISEPESYYDSTAQMYVEPFLPHRASEKIFDIQFLDESHLLSSSPFCTKIWNIQELCGVDGRTKDEQSKMKVTGMCTLSHKYYSNYDDTSVQSCNVVPAIHSPTGHLLTGCKDGHLYIWNTAIHTQNTNKRTNFTTRIKQAHVAAIRSLCCSHEGDLFASCDQLGHLYISSIYDGTSDDNANNMNDNNWIDLNCSFDSNSSRNNTSQISIDMSSIFFEDDRMPTTTRLTTDPTTVAGSVGSGSSSSGGEEQYYSNSSNEHNYSNLFTITSSPQKRSKDAELESSSRRKKKKK
ncbi:hypothetical protein C9374_009474 [Naegleria lovaniensis]|uniref:Guanine nucleotide-binding protein subunit beta-like protein n=1 Tax=Naegleria lovaniensis TaxID=51637 RepID=A0AA88H4N7_NAELO|nr:uncharacterized protein C9374_009474 [Naegleria lovaniensis]KAG2392897.1 hypothetical protein C9374_009474 [Naegleria lovaniensis]